MAVTVRQTESEPEKYPAVSYFRNATRPQSVLAWVEPSAVWQRIEAYVAYRWTPRSVVWIVEGEGHWTPPLGPVVSFDGAEVWDGTAWASTVPPNSPFGGYEFPGEGPYRIKATVGGGTVPKVVEQAFGRLLEYATGVDAQFRAEAGERGRKQAEIGRTGEIIEKEAEFVAGWAGKAIQLSGAADLLRPYRRYP